MIVQLHVPARLTTGTHWLGGWMSPKACHCVLEKTKIFAPVCCTQEYPVLSWLLYQLSYPGLYVESVGSSVVLVYDATEKAAFWGNLLKFRPKRRGLVKKLHCVVSQKTACEIIKLQTDELCPFSLVRSACETIQSQADESCPFTHSCF